MFIGKENECRRIVEKETEDFVDENFVDLEVSKDLRMINKDDLLVSGDFNNIYRIAEADGNSTWSAIETANPFEKYLNDAVCEKIVSGRWDELGRSAFLTVKYHKPANLIFQHLPVKERIINPYEHDRLEQMNCSRGGIVSDTIEFIDSVEIVNCEGVVLEVYEGFFRYAVQFNPYVDFVNDMFGKHDLYKKKEKLVTRIVQKTN